MQQAHLHLIKYALKAGCTISVDGGGDQLDLVNGNQYQQIKDDVEAVDMATMLINKDGKQVGWASMYLEQGQDPEETVSDFSVTSFMNAWEKEYYEGGSDA